MFFLVGRHFAFNKNIQLKKIFFFDFSHHTTHLGDRLFYFPLISALLRDNKKVVLEPKDKLTKDLFKAIYKKTLVNKSKLDSEELIYVSPQSSFIARLVNIIRYTSVIVKFNQNSERTVVQQVCDKFGYLEVNVGDLLPRPSSVKTENSNVVLFSNYIDSGFFRKWFVNENKLIEKCLELKSKGLEVWHVGTALDEKNDKKEYRFIDKDLRGKLSLHELVRIIREHDVTIVSFDNFLMHLGNIYEREVFILFRGRFKKKAVDFHMKSVNLCLCRDITKTTYL